MSSVLAIHHTNSINHQLCTPVYIYDYEQKSTGQTHRRGIKVSNSKTIRPKILQKIDFGALSNKQTGGWTTGDGGTLADIVNRALNIFDAQIHAKCYKYHKLQGGRKIDNAKIMTPTHFKNQNKIFQVQSKKTDLYHFIAN